MEMIVRTTCNLGEWLLAAALCIVAMIWAVLANYLACKGAFELMGFEMKPHEHNDLVGSLLGAIFPSATLSHLFLLAESLSIAVGFFLFFNLVFHIYDCMQDRADYLAIGDETSARAMIRLIFLNSLTLLILAIPLVVAAIWEIALLRFHPIAGASGILVHNRAWVYLAILLIACLCLELAIRKLREVWICWHAACLDNDVLDSTTLTNPGGLP